MAKKGGLGSGVSTHARSNGSGGAESIKTYNAWSKGHVFISPLSSEAKSYAVKMKENSSKETKVIHIFADPDWAAADIKPDLDSKAGLKTDGDMKLIGNGQQLNQKALNLLQAIINHLGYSDVTHADINSQYQGNW